MNFTTLVSPQEASELCGTKEVLLVDCRHELTDPGKGLRAWAEAHLPGAVFADVDRDLSDLRRTGLGRHPLPAPADFARRLAQWGWTERTQVIAYDDASGAYAARLWWMLRLCGHRDVAVLDGGYAGWRAAGLPLSDEPATEAGGVVEIRFDVEQVVLFAELERGMAERRLLLLDARARPRYLGEVEPIDAMAGHVPGALNRPYSDNLDVDQRFRSPGQLREAFETLLGDYEPEQVVHMCGSGVTACHNLLAMEHAGLCGSRVFAPSWSGWISDPTRPVARGE